MAYSYQGIRPEQINNATLQSLSELDVGEGLIKQNTDGTFEIVQTIPGGLTEEQADLLYRRLDSPITIDGVQGLNNELDQLTPWSDFNAFTDWTAGQLSLKASTVSVNALENRVRYMVSEPAFRIGSTGYNLISADGSPEAANPVEQSRIVTEGPGYAWSVPGSVPSVLTRSWIKHRPGIILEIEIEVKTVANPNAHDLAGLALGVRYYDDAGLGQGQSNYFFTAPPVGETLRVKRLYSNPAVAGGSIISNWAYYRARFLPNRNANGSAATGADVRVLGLSIRDVTDYYNQMLAKANQQDLDNINASLDNKADLVDGKVPLTQLPPFPSDPTQTVLEYNASGVLVKTTETINGTPRVTDLIYTNGVLTSTVETHNGTTKTTVLTYTNGLLTDVTVS